MPSPAKSSRSIEAPEPPVVSFWGGAFWFFTAEGRARRHLLLAHRRPEESGLLDALKKDAESMLTNLDGVTGTAKPLLEQLLYYVAWRALAASSLEKVAETLASLDKVAPSLGSVPPLRLSLMDGLCAKPDNEGFLKQARLFMEDPRSVENQFTTEVLQVVDRVYTRMGADQCGKILKKAHRKITDRERLQTAITLCATPAVIESQDDARQIDAAHLDFSPLMMADAHLVNARRAECEEEIDLMLTLCKASHELVPSHPSAKYWLARANLYTYSRQRNPAEHIAESQIPANPAWKRLMLYVGVYRNPGARAAVTLLQILGANAADMGLTETRLAAGLVLLALENDPAATAIDHLKEVAQLCLLVQQRVGTMPWTQYFIAYKEVLVDKQYEAAHARLEPEAKGFPYPAAKNLYRVVQIMRGAPLAPGDAFGMIERAMHALTRPPANPALPAALPSLDLREVEKVTQQFPDSGEVAKTLALALRALNGGDAKAGPETQALQLSRSAPRWVLWLRGRVLNLTGDRSGAEKVTVETGSLFEAVCAKEAKLDADLGSARAALAQGSPEKAIKLLAALETEVNSTCVITDAWWGLLVKYWRGTAYAHAQDGKAAGVLAALAGTVFGPQAAGQLALLALQRGDMAAAAERLQGAPGWVCLGGLCKSIVACPDGLA